MWIFLYHLNLQSCTNNILLLSSFKNAQRETRDVNRRFVLQAIIVLGKLPFYGIKAKHFYTEMVT